jgi:tRNA (guanine37-N1)-methyltransferase
METVDIHGFASDKHRTVDDTPFGGGPGMVMRADVAAAALDSVPNSTQVKKQGKTPTMGARPAVYLSPRGPLLTQERVGKLAAGNGVILLCGRYEGLDERVLETRDIEEISLGDYVLSGGEPAALVLIDACVRLLPGVVGGASTLEEESFERGLLEYPHYTRPQTWAGKEVPEILLSGHHDNIRAWRRSMAEKTTRERRPDLWKAYLQQQGKDRK